MKYKILIFFTAIFILSCTDEEAINIPLVYYVPQNAALVIKINDFSAFKNDLKNNDFFTELRPSSIYNTILEKTKHLEYLQPESESILAFSELEKGKFEFTYVVADTLDFLKFDSIQNKSITSTPYKNGLLYTYQIDSTLFYGTQANRKMVISSSQVLLENLIDSGGTGTEKTASLKKLYEAANDAKSASVFINLKNCNDLITVMLNDASKIRLSSFSDWISLDINTSKDQINLNGISIANDSLSNYVDLFKNTNPMTNTTASFAPQQTDAILSYTFDNYPIFAKNQQRYLNQDSPIDSLFNTVEEIGFIYLGEQKAVVLNTYGSEPISEYLKGIQKDVFDFQGNEIIALNEGEFLNSNLNPLVQNYPANFYTIIANAFVFATNKETLQTIISNYKNGTSFDKTAIYLSAIEELAAESTLLFISNSNTIEKTLKNDFSKEFYTDFRKASSSKYVFAAQMIADHDFYHTNIIIGKIEKETKTKSVSPFFTVQLDGEMATNPQFVTNHITNKKEILVQDKENTLYLISNKGDILWKKQLEGNIQGKIEQVDIFKNGRLQFAFTTHNQFLVLDRKGKEIAQLCKSFEGGNLNPLAVFDYEQKKDYRFVITQGDNIKMYNSKGAIVDGFTYTKAEKSILGTPKHFRIATKDYLVFKLEDGSLKILNRVGAERIKTGEKIDFSENQIYLFKNKFTLTDKKGTLYQINENGKINKTNLNLSNDHGIDATSKTLVVMNDNTLSIRGKQVELELGVYTHPKIFYLYDKIYVSVTDIQNQKIYLFDSQAKSIPNFPVFGTSLIDLDDLDNDRKPELVSQDQDNSLIIYKLN